MHAERSVRLRYGLPAGLVLAGVVLGYAGAVAPEPPASSKEPAKAAGVLFPPNQAVLLKGSFDVICRADKAALEIDGKPYPWESFHPPVYVARVRLAPGLHELRIGSRRREFIVAMNEEEHDGPEEWAHHRFHPIESDDQRCAHCHQTEKKAGRIAVGELRSYKACLECHPSVQFEAIHSHPLEPIEHCQTCHALHGSSRKGLLKAPVKQLCLDCHDA